MLTEKLELGGNDSLFVATGSNHAAAVFEEALISRLIGLYGPNSEKWPVTVRHLYSPKSLYDANDMDRSVTAFGGIPRRGNTLPFPHLKSADEWSLVVQALYSVRTLIMEFYE